ncbi:D-isomer specific 2-hydroxyacid dehydrogenase NAD-binding protein [Flammeovirgaceae bacterium 311]|nr:D-isomer specific 2-hydroxyacid dehydrogenase NAD-binding protein [Flammeovirgaceae bacterium 311]
MNQTKPKVLIIDDMHESIIPLLEETGFEPHYKPTVSAKEVPALLAGYEVLFLRSKLKVTAEVLAQADSLKVIGRAGAGLDLIDLEAVSRRNIQLVHASEGNRDAVAEHAVGMLLCLFNNLTKADRQVRQKQWLREENRGVELGEMTVGIVGFGYMGQAFARRLTGFGCRIIAYDNGRKGFGSELVEEVSLEKLQEEADVVSFHIPLNQQNRGLVNTAYLEAFKKNIYLINTARGEIIPLQDLAQALKSGKVKAAALDVLENEKLHQLSPLQQDNFSYLITNDNVLLSPHVAGWTHESYKKINQVLVRKLKDVYSRIS